MVQENLHEKTSVKIADKYEADLEIKFDVEIKGSTSHTHKNKKDAKDEAYYNAITNNGVHVLINPIYKVSQVGKNYDCEVVGFGAKYSNPKVSGADASGEDSGDEIEKKLAQLERFSKIEGVQAGLRQSSYIVDTREGCCGDEKAGKYGATNLLHATDNKSSLVDEYYKFINGNEKSEVEAIEKTKTSFFKKLLSKIPIIKHFVKQ
jgi:hypothetical protein